MTSYTQPNIIPSTVNSTVSGQPWCKTEWSLREVVSHGKKYKNKPNVGLIDQLQRGITLSAKMRQKETKLFDLIFTWKNFWKKYSRVYLSMCLLFIKIT